MRLLRCNVSSFFEDVAPSKVKGIDCFRNFSFSRLLGVQATQIFECRHSPDCHIVWEYHGQEYPYDFGMKHTSIKRSALVDDRQSATGDESHD